MIDTNGLLWWARVWIDENGLQRTVICNCETGEVTDEWHPVEED